MNIIQLLEQIFGPYTPEYTYQIVTDASGQALTDESGNVIQYITHIHPDIAWIAGVAIFALCIYGLFRLVGG